MKKNSVFVACSFFLFTGAASALADNYSTAVENLNPVLYYRFQANLTSNSASGSDAASASLDNSGTTSLSQVTGPRSAGFESDNLGVGGFTAGSGGTLLTVDNSTAQNSIVSELNGGGGITVSAWFDLSSAVPSTGSSDVQTIANLIVGSTTSTAFQLNLTSSGITFEGRGKAGDTINTLTEPETLSLNTWYDVVGVLNLGSKTINLYLDGSLIGTEAATGWSTSTVSLTDGSNAGQFTVGSLNSNGAQAFTSGSLDEEALYNSALSASQISGLYEAAEAVPEPSTWALLALGIFLLAIMRPVALRAIR